MSKITVSLRHTRFRVDIQDNIHYIDEILRAKQIWESVRRFIGIGELFTQRYVCSQPDICKAYQSVGQAAGIFM